MKLDKLVIYKAGCLAGFTSAWIMHQHMREGLDHPAILIVIDPELTVNNVRVVSYTYEYGEATETITVGYLATNYSREHQFLVNCEVVDNSTRVFMVGLSMPPEKAAIFAESVSSLNILDACQDTTDAYEKYFGNHAPMFGQNDPGNVLCLNDPSFTSSVSLFYGTLNCVDSIEEMPTIVQYVHANEIREFNKYSNNKEIIAALYSYRFDFMYWDAHFTTRNGILALIPEGKAIIRFKHQMIKAHKKLVRSVNIFGHTNIPMVNAPREIINEVLLELAHTNPFVIGYHDVQRKRVYTIRSVRDNIDVGEFAVSVGGTGHKNLAWYSEVIE